VAARFFEKFMQPWIRSSVNQLTLQKVILSTNGLLGCYYQQTLCHGR